MGGRNLSESAPIRGGQQSATAVDIKVGGPGAGRGSRRSTHDGGNICIAVEDDGRGLNREKIVSKAIERGIIADGATMSDENVYRLIFRAGFSTADQVTDV